MENFKYLNETAGCIFKCETIKIKLAKNMKKKIFKQKTCVYNVIIYQIFNVV